MLHYPALRRTMDHDPLHDPSNAAAPSAAAAPQPVRVLLAEDDPVSQHVVTVLLDRLGYQRDLVTDGQEALIILARRFYDIILLDLSMPGLDGISVAQRVRASEGSGPRQYIIALSTSTDGSVRARCTAAGMDAFVAKPIALHNLDRALQRALQSRRDPADAERCANADADSKGQDSGEFTPGGASPAPTAGGRPQLRVAGDAELDSAVPPPLSSYLGRGQALLATMRTASQAGDRELMRRSALNLKGIARLLGAFELASLCAELETAPSSSARALSLEAVAEIEAEFGRFRSSLIAAQSR